MRTKQPAECFEPTHITRARFATLKLRQYLNADPSKSGTAVVVLSIVCY